MVYKFIEGYRLGDWTIYCMTCGSKTWASDSQVLSNETGRGGLRVCPDCVDVIDYGIVPYKIPAEQPIPYASYLLPTPIDPFPSFPYETFNPLSTTPQQLLTPSTGLTTWDVTTTNWDNESNSW